MRRQSSLDVARDALSERSKSKGRGPVRRSARPESSRRITRGFGDGDAGRVRLAAHARSRRLDTRTIVHVLSCAAVLLLALPEGVSAQSQAPQVERPTARATRTSAAIKVDGQLDEAAWADAVPIGRLMQRVPDENAAATEDTEIRVLYTTTTLYFGILCRDRTPNAIVSTRLTRDADIESDDGILIALDPFLDHRNGFFFAVNPAGARVDGQIENNAEHLSTDWDGIWEASARITPDGWVAEIAIPFKTLRFKPGQTVWGLNVERLIKRRNEADLWATPRRDNWVTNMSQAGRLEGIEGISQGRGLDIRPYVSGGSENSDGKLQAGVDVFKNLTPNLNASVTVNTDFAETEADTRQVNLTRFPLFFPEKRAFFLEGAGVFEVAATNEESVLPFFSRRIGLLEGREVPIMVGTKIVGRQSDYNIGVLDVQTRGVDDFGGEEGRRLDSQNLFAARVSRNIFRQSWIGGIVTHGNPDGTGQNTLLGADVRLATSEFKGNKNLSTSAFFLRTDDEASGKTDYAFGGNVDYPNDLWDASFGWQADRRRLQPGARVRAEAGDPPHLAGRGLQAEARPFRNPPVRIPGASGVGQRPAQRHADVGGVQRPAQRRVRVGRSRRVQRHAPVRAAHRAVRDRRRRRDRARRIPDEPMGIPGRDGRQAAADRGGQLLLGRLLHRHSARRGARRDGQAEQAHLRLAAIRTQRRVAQSRATSACTWSRSTPTTTSRPTCRGRTCCSTDSESRVLGVQSRFRWIIKPGSDLFLVINRGWYRTRMGQPLRAPIRQGVGEAPIHVQAVTVSQTSW